jgi:hypothetical protein
MKPIEGGCLCGAVRYKSTAAPTLVRACWCRVCQFFASGNATINVVFPKDAVTFTGEMKDYPSSADSGSHMHRRFCPKCGVHLVSEAEERPQVIILRAGTLDDASVAVPQGNIWTKSAPPWAHLDPKLPAFEGQPPPPAPKN